MGDLLDKIKEPNDVRKIPEQQLPALAVEIRKLILESVSKNGGHLASSLGTVELTIALHRILHFPEDKLIWDVGHQAYTHKILTGRQDTMRTLRTFGGISGFPKRAESDCDAFDTGHSATSISVAAGMVKARELTNGTNRVVAVIGDGSLSGGLAYEALNNIGRFQSNVIIVLNDNEMSISKNVGGMANYLGKMRVSSNYLDFKGSVEQALNKSSIGEKVAKGLKKTKDSIRQIIIPGDFFNEMGLNYFGPIDGHNIADMEKALHAAEKIKGAVLLHIVTKKGKGYRYAETEPSRFHGIDAFRIASGEPINKERKETYTDVFGKQIVALAKANPKLVAITAAMTGGTGLGRFQSEFPNRFFDVGIAEEHAVTFAAGLSVSGFHPVVAIYSTFLQRAYDQILHDVCIGKLPVTLAIDRAGIVGNDGETHQGIFDLAYLQTMPNMTVMAPANGIDLEKMLAFATNYDGPTAVRYPRGAGGCVDIGAEGSSQVVYGKAEPLLIESDIAILYLGPFTKLAMDTRELALEKGHRVSVINARFAMPFDETLIQQLSWNHRLLVTIEEGVRSGGFGEHIANYVMEQNLPMHVTSIALPNTFIEQGDQEFLRERFGLTKEAIHDKIETVWEQLGD